MQKTGGSGGWRGDFVILHPGGISGTRDGIFVHGGIHPRLYYLFRPCPHAASPAIVYFPRNVSWECSSSLLLNSWHFNKSIT